MVQRSFRLPDIGEGLAEAEVVKWLVEVGEPVFEDQPVVELMTDKASVELPAPASGTLAAKLVEEGQMAKVGQILFVIEQSVQEGRGPGIQSTETASVADRQALGQHSAIASDHKTPLPLASPAVRKMAREMGVDLAGVIGSGPHGRVTADDLKTQGGDRLQAPATPDPAGSEGSGASLAEAGEEERIPLRGAKRRMAQAMAESARSIAHVTGFHELDATWFAQMLDRLKSGGEERGQPVRLEVLLVRIAVRALRRHPEFNAWFQESSTELMVKRRLNVGVATSTAHGLLVPVVRNADQLSLWELAAEVERLIAAARSGSIVRDDLQGGTFTVSNTGAWSGWFGTSLIPPPQVALMAVGRIQDRPVVRAGQIVIRSILPLAISFDHRVIDGDQGLRFASTVRQLVESPERILIED